MLEVIDRDGSKRDLVWLQQQYGVGIAYHAAEQYPRFELQKVFVTEGPTVLRFTVLGADGKPCVGQPVAYSFPSLGSPSGDLAAVPAGADKSRWFGRACIERCNPRGEHEFEIGKDSWIKSQVGPYSVAVISPSTYSDCLSGAGWLGGTNHRGPCEFVFREVLKPGDEEPPQEGSDLGAVVAAIDRLRVALVEALCEVGSELIGLNGGVDAILTGVDWVARGRPAAGESDATGGDGTASLWGSALREGDVEL